MKKSKLVWTARAKRHLRGIRDDIAKEAPRTALAFVNRLKKSADRLRFFPEAGAMVEGFEGQGYREIYFASYRIIYQVRDSTVQIIMVRHGARLLGENAFEGG